MSDVYARATIRKDKGIEALRKLGKIFKKSAFHDAADALSLIPLDLMASHFTSAGNLGKDLLFFNHNHIDFTDEKVKELTELIAESVPHIVDLYRAASAVAIYASTVNPPLPGIPDATKEDYKNNTTMINRIKFIKDALFTQAAIASLVPSPLLETDPVNKNETQKPDDPQSTPDVEEPPTTE